MQPVLDEGGFAEGGLALRDFVLVVGENQVNGPAVDVQLLAQVLARHDTAFNVPARPSLAPGALPGGLPGLGLLPQREVRDVFLLVLVGFHARAGDALVQLDAGEPAIALESGHGIVDAVFGLVGEPVFFQGLDGVNDFLDVFGDTRVFVRGLDAERVHVLEEELDVFFGELENRYSLLVGALDHVVVDVGEVDDVTHLVTGIFQVAADDVEGRVGARVTDVPGPVHRGAADVHANFPVLQGLEVLQLLGQGVLDAKHGIHAIIEKQVNKG